MHVMGDLNTIILGFFILIYSVILHEIAHGYIAERLGDPTARNAGRLTLNPIPHIDPIMTIAIPAFLFISAQIFGGGILFGAAKPVPINPLYFDDPKKDTALVSLAGVITNFALAGIAAILYNIGGSGMPIVATALQFMVLINLLLGVFNLIPIPPLDGSKVLASLLPKNAAQTLLSLEPFGFILILGLFFFSGFGGLIGRLVATLMGVLNVPYF